MSLLYRGGTVRIDEYDGRFDLAFTKTTDDLTFLTIAGTSAIWLPDPHTLTYVDGSGQSHPATTRLAGPTLLWDYLGVGYRIEGFATPTEQPRRPPWSPPDGSPLRRPSRGRPGPGLTGQPDRGSPAGGRPWRCRPPICRR